MGCRDADVFSARGVRAKLLGGESEQGDIREAQDMWNGDGELAIPVCGVNMP